MKHPLATAGATALAFCALDFAWLSLMSPTFYQGQIGSLLLDAPRVAPALAFYLLYVAGLLVFCVSPAADARRWRMALARGAFFGLVAYATYDLSNLATLRGWTLPLSIVDMLWGALASGLASTCGYLVATRNAFDSN